MQSQLELARVVCADSPFSLILQKRLAVLLRIFHAVTSKYHKKSCSNSEWKNGLHIHTELENQLTTSISGNDALIETAVKTGLSLVFSLLKQNWALSSIISSNMSFGASTLCNDVLTTALDVVQGLPMLSLSNESKLSSLAISTLQQVNKFLTSITNATQGMYMIWTQCNRPYIFWILSENVCYKSCR